MGLGYVCGKLSPEQEAARQRWRKQFEYTVNMTPIFGDEWRCEQRFIDWAKGGTKGRDDFKDWALNIRLETELKELFLKDLGVLPEDNRT